MASYLPQYDPVSGHCTGVVRDDGAVIPRDTASADWQAFLAWNATQITPVSLANIAGVPRRLPRPLLAIYTDLLALTAAQKTNIGNDLFAGSPMKVLTDTGPNTAAIAVLHWGAVNAGLGAAAVTDAKLRAAAMYAQDQPKYLVHPAFDASINLPGDMATP